MSNARKPKKPTPTPAAAAAKEEAEGVEMATITWRDLTPFQVPRNQLDWPFEASIAAEEYRYPAMLAALMPAEIRAEFAQMGCTRRDAYDLVNTLSDALGFAEPGE